jgi:hypothetical protein
MAGEFVSRATKIRMDYSEYWSPQGGVAYGRTIELPDFSMPTGIEAPDMRLKTRDAALLVSHF